MLISLWLDDNHILPRRCEDQQNFKSTAVKIILNNKKAGKAAAEATNQKDDTKHKAAALSCKPN